MSFDRTAPAGESGSPSSPGDVDLQGLVETALVHIATHLSEGRGAKGSCAADESVERDAHRLILQLVAHAEAEAAGIRLPGGFAIRDWADPDCKVENPSGRDLWLAWTEQAQRLVSDGGSLGRDELDSGLSLFTPLQGLNSACNGLANQSFASICFWANVLASRVRDAIGSTVENRLGAIHEILLASRVSVDPAGHWQLDCEVAAKGSRRSRQGSFFTRNALIDYIADECVAALDNEAAEAPKICDPSCGSGNILLGVARRFASRQGDGERALREILETGCYGADVDRIAVDICRYSCWHASGGDAQVALAVGRHIVWGNALLGVTPLMISEGLGAGSFKPLAGESPNLVARLAASLGAEQSDSQMDLFAELECDAPTRSGLQSDELFTVLATPVTEATYHGLLDLIAGTNSDVSERLVRAAVAEHRPVHWHLQFPDLFATDRGSEDDRTGWSGGFDVVCGNPPFLSQLSKDTATERRLARALGARYHSMAKYTNPSTLFLLLASELARYSGCVVMVQPESVLAARDSESARVELSQHTSPVGLWVSAGDMMFDAAVNVCVVSLLKDRLRQWKLRRSHGECFTEMAERCLNRTELESEPTWSWLVAAAHGVPEVVDLHSTRVLGEVASFTADFRDQYYGLIPYVVDAEDGDEQAWRLMTVGLIDLAHNRWGEVPARFGKQEFLRPSVTRQIEDDPSLGRWVRQRSVPKVLVATQTKVLECVVDEDGSLIPSVPTVSAVPRGCTLWELAAVIGSPVASAFACERWLGAGMSSGVLKASARQLGSIPLPMNLEEWGSAAALFSSAQSATTSARRLSILADFGLASCSAYGLDEATSRTLLEWWLPRATRGR